MVLKLLRLIFRLLNGLIFRRVLTAYRRNFSAAKENLDLSGKTVLITGAASGFGRQFALDFMKLGPKRAPAKLILWDLNSLEEFANDPKIDTCQLDTTDYDKVGAEIDRHARKNTNIDICICNAGIVANTFFSKIPFAKYRKTIEVNFLSKVFLTREVLEKHVPERIVYISSVASYVSSATQTEYSPSKHAIRSFAEAIDAELRIKKSKTKISTICPYFCATNLVLKNEHFKEKNWKRIPAKVSIADVSAALFDAIYYDMPELIVGRMGLAIKWTYHIFGPRGHIGYWFS